MLAPNAFVQNRYLFVRRLGGGERSAVYEAIDMTTRAHVALKQVIVGTDAADARRAGFEHEAQRLIGLRHPALPALHDSFVEGDSLFLAAEFVPGDDLMTQLERAGNPFPLVQVLRWAEHLLDALDYLHSQLPPVIHRDITPRNLKLTPRGQMMLLDVGLAQSEALPAQAKPAGAESGFAVPVYAAGAGGANRYYHSKRPVRAGGDAVLLADRYVAGAGRQARKCDRARPARPAAAGA